MRVLGIAALAVAACACGPAARPAEPPNASLAGSTLPDVRLAKDRPPVVLVSRDGDPAGAVSAAIATAFSDGDAEPAVALAGVVEARLAAHGLDAIVTPSWEGFRATVLIADATAARATTEALARALLEPIDARDVAPAQKKIEALAMRPLRDESLARWARCVGSPYASPGRAAKPRADLTVTELEGWRRSSHALGRTAFAVASKRAAGEEVAAAIARGPSWPKASPLPTTTAPSRTEIDVYEAPGETTAVLHATLAVESSSAAVAAAEALGDPRGPLATRLSTLDLPFRLREVTGTAHATGGCVGIVLEAAASEARENLALRAADAIALVRREADVHLKRVEPPRDGRLLSRRSGDSREAAERAAWWTLTPPPRGGAPGSGASGGAVALAVPALRAAPPKEKEKEAIEPSREALARAIESATAAWAKPVADARVRLEPGQGEALILLASPCGTDAESEADAGLTALFVAAAAEMSKSSPEARVEPWIVPDGAGLLVHGPALEGETPAAHARRLADVVARSFASEPITASALARARGALLRRDAVAGGAALSTLAGALSPQHPSWVLASGRDKVLSRSADAAVIARAQALRAGPLRVAILANVDAAQAEAATQAVDRWIERRAGDARSCKPASSPSPPKPGTYAAPPRPGSSPEAYLAFPFSAGDEKARAAAELLATALEHGPALLDKALGGAAALASRSSARVLGWPRAPALVIRIESTQAQLDGAVMQTRALLDRLRQGGLAAEDFSRAVAASPRARTTALLDPRARLVATWRGEPLPPAAPRLDVTAEELRAFARQALVEDAMIVVAARPGRPAPVAAQGEPP